ncbi:MAG: hybrid sensor histidine kinase/response regulator [Candidatus Omnitrophota bacterium]|jgi:signal transduction histidine kinase
MEKQVIKVLIIDFSGSNISRIKNALSKIPDVSYDISWPQVGENVLASAEEGKFDVILLSYDLSGLNGLEVLSDLQYKELSGPVIMLADAGDKEFAAQAIRDGAYDYVIREKGFEGGLPVIIYNAITAFRAVKERERLQKEIAAKKAELEAANKKLQQIDKIKSDFVANVAHEFRTPLTIIKGNVDIVNKGGLGPVTPGQKEMLDGAVNVANRLSRLVNDLLDISKIESGKMELKKEPVYMNKIIEENLAVFDKIIKDKKQSVRKELAADVPAVSADRDKVTQVFINLLSNAIKYTPESREISVKSVNLDREIMIEVCDAGEGIAPENLEKIFDKFTRVTAEKKEGTGLGLPIARDIVNLHNGRMWVKSEIGKGSQFYFTLPK